MLPASKGDEVLNEPEFKSGRRHARELVRILLVEDDAIVRGTFVLDLPVIENGSYHRLLLLFRGDLPSDSLLPSPDRRELETVEDVTLAYGIGTWHAISGRPAEASAMYRKIVASPQWAAFGYLAAEQEVKRER